jgi:hypothetical protein
MGYHARMKGILLVLLAAGCYSAPPEPKPGCNPIDGDDCLSPFPSDFYRGATSVQIPDGVLPVQANGIPLSPARLNQKSGFSPATAFYVYFKAGVDPSRLPGGDADSLAASVMSSSAVQVIKASDGTRVPVMAELDANVVTGDRQALIVRPMQRLEPNQRYLVALVNLLDGIGLPLVTRSFFALRDQHPLSKALEKQKAHYDEIFSLLGKYGVERGRITLAWDVTTSDDGATTGRLTGMRDQALAMAPSLGYTITAQVDSPGDANLLRQVQATVQTPWFLADQTQTSLLNFGSDGNPVMTAVADVPIVINIPQCSINATGPLPLVVFGHGLFGNALTTLKSGTLQRIANQSCAIYAATDWIGVATDDKANVANAISADLNGAYLVQDRLQQAHVNNLMMTRQLLTKLKDDPSLQPSGKALFDGSTAYYFGVSNGGIQGGTFLALTPDVQRGVLNVPGANWSLLIFRSTDFNSLRPLLASALPDPFDAQIAVGLLQSEWDFTDPGTYAPHLLAHPLDGVTVKQVLVQESEGDAQVSNLATRYLARTLGLDGIEIINPVYGVAEKSAPLDSAYTQWDSHLLPLPPDSNTSLSDDNNAHGAVWASDLAEQQIRAFLAPGGQVTDVCGGPCNL